MTPPDSIGAPQLVLSVAQLFAGTEVDVGVILSVSDVLGVRSGAVRVALTRLVKRGLIEHVDAGRYQLAKRADPVQQHLDAWVRGEGRLRPWAGSWLAYHFERPESRTTRRRSLMALSRLGFAEARQGLWVRPDCLAHEVEPVVRSLGLESGALGMVLSGPRWDLWDGEALSRGYRDDAQRLAESLERLSTAPLRDGLRESFVLGRRMIESLAFDPLLPAPLVDAEARAGLTTHLRTYDEAARSHWATYLGLQLERRTPHDP